MLRWRIGPFEGHAVVAGMRAHVGVAKVQEWGITALANIADDNHEGSGAVTTEWWQQVE